MIDDDELLEFEEHVCPGCGSCSGMYTANSMNCLSEAVGIALPGNGTIPAVDSGRIRLAKHAGMAIMNLVEKDIKARDIINEKSLRNALACDMALGCSSNSVLHLLAIANEAGVELNLDIFNEFSAKVPNLCHLAPAGGTHMHDLNRRRRTACSFQRADQERAHRRKSDNCYRQDCRREHQGRIRQELRYHQTYRQAVQ